MNVSVNLLINFFVITRVEALWLTAEPCIGVGIQYPLLAARLLCTAQTLVPNNIISARRQHSYPRYFGSRFVQQEEGKTRPHLIQVIETNSRSLTHRRRASSSCPAWVKPSPLFSTFTATWRPSLLTQTPDRCIFQSLCGTEITIVTINKAQHLKSQTQCFMYFSFCWREGLFSTLPCMTGLWLAIYEVRLVCTSS